MTPYNIIVAWLVSSMSAWTPPGLSWSSRVVIEQCDEQCQKAPTCDRGGVECEPPRKIGGVWTRQERKEEAQERYERMAQAIVRNAYNPEERPLFAGADGRARTALWMAAVAWGESSFRRDVTEGEGPHGKGDHGQSFCAMQIHLPGATTYEGMTGKDVLASYDSCFRAGLHKLQQVYCADVKTQVGRWSGYRGHCTDSDPVTAYRLARMNSALSKQSAPVTDAEVEVPLQVGAAQSASSSGAL
jgi:hypothetical protein